MPVLHKYKNRNEYYILTMIGKAVATFHLKPEGYRKLAAAGIKKGATFPRALLLDLYRVGDAYTHEPASGDAESKQPKLQLKLDFPDDPEPASLFPHCSACSSVDDLHVVEIKQPEHIAAILCASCRAKKIIDSSIPLELVAAQRHCQACAGFEPQALACRQERARRRGQVQPEEGATTGASPGRSTLPRVVIAPSVAPTQPAMPARDVTGTNNGHTSRRAAIRLNEADPQSRLAEGAAA